MSESVENSEPFSAEGMFKFGAKPSKSIFVEHVVNYYKELEADAKSEMIEDTELLVFRGSLTEAWKRAGISMAYYSKVRKALQDGGYIQLVQSGSRNRDTCLVLVGAPDPDELMGQDFSDDLLTPRTPYDKLAARVLALEEWVANLGGLNITKALENHEGRIEAMEGLKESNAEKP